MFDGTIALGDVAFVRRGASPRPIGDPRWFSNSGPGWVRIADVTRANGLLQETEQRLSPAGVARSVPVAHGDLIMSICATVGEPVIVDMHACIHDGFVLLEDFGDSFDTRFLYHFLHFNKQKLRSFGQTGTQANVNTNIVRQIQLPNISIDSQRRIALILDTADAAIAKTEALIAKLKQMKAGLLHDLLTRGIDENGEIREERSHEFKDSIYGRIPSAWSIATADSICTAVIDCKNRTPPDSPSGFHVVKTPNVRDGRLILESMTFTDHESYEIWTARGKPIPGDILVTREAPVGEAGLVTADMPPLCLGQRMTMYKIDRERINPEFLLYMFLSRRVQDGLAKRVGGSTVGHVRVGDIRFLPIPICSLAEQNRIASKISGVIRRLNQEQRISLKLNKLKAGLMNDLLTGKKSVLVDAAAAT